jgi:NADH:ubiquinone oxidoreductase subunit 5 (subunit L)/multisubunit Na+/H+ antiporter MnhA subunit/multisubunit Na+/H+ antiporter MnhB subunit
LPFALIVLVPFVLAAGAAVLRPRTSVQGGIAAAGMAVLFVLALLQLGAVTEAGALVLTVPWVPQIGLAFSLYVDGLALLFTLLVTGIGVAVMLYAGFYFDDPRKCGRFLALLLAFTGSMLLLVLAGNILTLFIAWELTSIISFLLISFYGKDPAARRGASQALMITGGGGLALFVGLVLAGTAAGSMELADILTSGDLLRENAWYTAITVLLMIGAFSKSAQFPLHFWLPNAMSAPTPASAFLHSATMVKAGIYLLARFSPVLGDTPLWTTALPVFGLATMLVGGVFALRQRDLKGMLAYTTIAMLGSFVALIGVPGGEGLKAAYVGLLGHGLYKCALFLVVGAVDHATGTRDIDRLGGLRAQMPGFAIVTAIAGLSMAGVPPLMGFVGKELLLVDYEASPVALAVIMTSAICMVAVAGRLFWDVFMRPAPAPHHDEAHGDGHHDDGHHGHALPRGLVAGPAGLAALSIIGGLGIGPLITPLVQPAVGKPITLYLLPPYINLPLILSLTALALGALLFFTRRVWLAWALPGLPQGTTLYHAMIGGVERTGDQLLKLQGGKIRYYLAVILATVAGLLAIALVRIIPFSIPPITIANASDALKGALLILSLIATGYSLLVDRHIVAALSLGLAGYAIGGIFLLEPAPDVALVQFLVETLATVLIFLILARTSEKERRAAMERLWGQTRRGLVRDLAIAGVTGAAMTIFALAAVSSRPTPNPISQWHLMNAPRVGVTDVVAGIVTDFRGTDTLIEITVFGMAALGVLTLLARPMPGKTTPLIFRFRRRKDAGMKYEPVAEPEQELPIVYRSHFASPVTQLAARAVLPVAFVIALGQIAYAGVAPGDGFTAGVIIGLGIALWFVVFGYQETKQRLSWLHPAPLIGLGITLALVNAALPLLLERPFLSFSIVDTFSLADIKLASTLIFEIAICLTVLGGVSTIMEAISHPRETEPL